MTCENGETISLMADKVTVINEVLIKTKDEIHQLHKLYHNEYAGRLRKVESDLHHYQEIEKGRAFDGILNELARLYSDNIAILNEITDEKHYKQLRYMFLDFLQLLESNGVSKQESSIEDKRNAKHCQIAERISTQDPSKHDMVAKSLNVGFYIENRTLIKERIHLYIYEEKEAPPCEANERED